jgi:hypothetical protein
MSAKEKALTLTAFFIYERIHRPYYAPHIEQEALIRKEMRFPFPYKPMEMKDRRMANLTFIFILFYPLSQPNEDIVKVRALQTETFWKSLVNCIKKNEDSKDIAFPAATVDEIKWQKQFSDVIAKYEDKVGKKFIWGDTPWYAETSIQELKNKLQADELMTIYEYLMFHGDRRSSRSAPYDGNSSSEPKTLGEIATELLKSRYNHDDVPIDGVLWK